MGQKYDVIIIGGGPAGLTSAIYTSRDRLATLIIERGSFGGMINEAEIIENYPGYADSVSGSELATQMHEQAKRFGAKEVMADVQTIKLEDGCFTVMTDETHFVSKSIILACGSEKRKLGVVGEREYLGKGVSYCATCDAAFFRNKIVAVVGGGNSALFEALALSKFVRKVYVLHRREQFRATSVVQERALAEPKIELVYSTVVREIKGEEVVTGIAVENVRNNQVSNLAVDGLFIAVGMSPNTAFLKNIICLNEQGMIVVDERMRTSVQGVFAAGDVRQNSIGQVISAAGDGAVAAISAIKWVADMG